MIRSCSPASRGTTVLLTVLALALASPRAQEVTLDEMLTRASNYVRQFRTSLSGIVSEEQYVQLARSPADGATRGFPRYEDERIVLRSDFLLVRPPGSDRQVEFRDVFEVNGRATRDRDERLTQLFINPTASAMAQVQRITNESARYNVGLIQRTLNTPTLALLFLEDTLQRRFSFVRVDDFLPSLELAQPVVPVQDEVWVLAYEETRRPTLIQGKDSRDLPARGRFWLRASDGRVMLSELILKDPEVEATVDVRYSFDSDLNHVVPVEMREFYSDLYGSRVEGTATYGNFRRFQVQVAEGVKPEDLPPDHD